MPRRRRPKKTPRYVRRWEYDKRIAWGHDFTGDAWLDRTTGKIVYMVVGFDPNAEIAPTLPGQLY
jgi:hypothetical protein